MLIIIILAWISLQKYSIVQACTTTMMVPCTQIDSTTRNITLNGSLPQGSCNMVVINSEKFIYDPIMINSVWITLVNTDAACITNIPAKAETIANSLGLLSTREIVLLSVTAQYYRFVNVNRLCRTCLAEPFSASLESQLKSKNLLLYPVFNDMNVLGPYCLNEGTLNTNYTGAGYKCICKGDSVFMGPRCEYMERTINTRQNYFNVFRNATNITVRFSLFSNGIAGNQSILTIKSSSYSKIVEIIVIESTVFLKTEDTKNVTIKLAIDNQTWYDFSVVVNQQNATLRINSLTNVSVFTIPPGDFRSFYLVLNETVTNTFTICIKNLFVSGRIIDLNNPQYASCCKNRCTCSTNQGCVCRPFVSVDPSVCYCNFGYSWNGSACVLSTPSYSQITDSLRSTMPINSNVVLSTVDFSFQTLFANGNVLTLNLITPPISVIIQIVNTNLTLNVSNQRLRTLNYNVSNGVVHTVTLTLTPHSIQMMLDGNANYSRTINNWVTQSVSSITANSAVIGVLQKPYNSSINTLTTCFSALQLNIATGSVNVPPVISTGVSPQCSTGPRCSSGTVSCPPNQVCNDSQWQNTQCISNCSANYTYVNGVCVCINNLCKNGVCYYNAATNNYTCNCTAGYTGTNCEIQIVVASLWWIAILIVLLLLLIILIILLWYCCCVIGRSKGEVSIITKVNENVGVYNEQAGESDYTGPPINFAIMKNALNKKVPPPVKVSFIPTSDLMAKKVEFDNNNDDLILDHPLEYGFEGYASENDSISSIGSKSGGSVSEFSLPALDVTNHASVDIYDVYN